MIVGVVLIAGGYGVVRGVFGFSKLSRMPGQVSDAHISYGSILMKTPWTISKVKVLHREIYVPSQKYRVILF